MKDTNILQANILDIIFDGKNKEYGAYELRTNYQKRLAISVIGMIVGCSAFLLIYSIASGRDNSNIPPPVETIVVINPPPENEPEKPVEIEKPKPQPPIAMEKFVTPLITTEEIKPEDEVPDMEDLVDVKIGPVDQQGDKDNGIVAPPIDGEGTQVIQAPKKEEEDWEKIFIGVQVESEYPGGISSWQRYLNRSFRYPQEAIDDGITGVVVVQFIVDKEGNVSDVEAISGPEKGGLREEAVRVIKKSGKWIPAMQNGRQVKSYKKQPIVFKLADE